MSLDENTADLLQGLVLEGGGVDAELLRRTLRSLQSGMETTASTANTQHKEMQTTLEQQNQALREQQEVIDEQANQLRVFAEDRNSLQASQLVAT